MGEVSKVGDGAIAVGRECSIGAGVRAIFAGRGSITFGDYVTIGENVKFIVESGDVVVGDWSTLHADAVILCKQGVEIGAHCWFGQSTVIDGTGGLKIGNGVRVGMFSQLWTHVAAGEQIEGCTLYGATPSTLEDDVWLVGTCTLGSGVTVGARTIALAGSNITKSCPANSVLAGAPAKVKEGLSFYRDITLDEKFAMLGGWLRDLAAQRASSEVSVESDGDTVLRMRWTGGESVHFHKHAQSFLTALVIADPLETHCCVETKHYRKQFGAAEQSVLRYLSGNKARFYAI